MDEFWWQTLWMATATVVIAYPTMLFIGSLSPSHEFERAVIALDEIDGSMHTLTGTLVVPSECHGLEARVVETNATSSSYHILFTTWQEPYRDCPRVSALKRFRVVLFAPPEGARFSASLDGAVMQLHVVETRVQ
jgi:hypothetical protein